MLRIQAGLRPHVGNRPAEPNIVAKDLGSYWILEDVVNIRLPNPEPAIDIASVVGLLVVSHVIRSPSNRIQSAFVRTMWQGTGLHDRYQQQAWALPMREVDEGDENDANEMVDSGDRTVVCVRARSV